MMQEIWADLGTFDRVGIVVALFGLGFVAVHAMFFGGGRSR